jgi:hypothetical protein
MMDWGWDMVEDRRVHRDMDESGCVVNGELVYDGGVHGDVVEGARSVMDWWGDVVHRGRIDWNVVQSASGVVDRRRLMLRRRSGVMNRYKDHLRGCGYGHDTRGDGQRCCHT